MKVKRLIPAAMLAAILLGFACPAAFGDFISYTTQNLQGRVTFADPFNPFGITTETPVLWTVVYDPSRIDEDGILSIDEDSSQVLNVSIGPLFFAEVDDTEYGDGHPEVWFNGGNVVGVNFHVNFWYPEWLDLTGLGITVEEEPTLYTFSAYGNSFEIYYDGGGVAMTLDQVGDGNVLLVEGENFSSNVPLPTAFWLLGSGLIALVGLSRRIRR